MTEETTQMIGQMPERALPETVEQVTPSWLAQVLGPAFPGYRLTHATTDRIIPGTATKILMTLSFEAVSGGPGITQKVCVKGAFDPAIRLYDLGTIFACEAAFYRDVGSRLDIELPRCFHADEDGVFGVLVLEDIAEQGASFVDVTSTWAPARAAELLKILARVHAFSWGWRPGVLPWLQEGGEALRNGIRGMAAADKFDDLIARPPVASHLPPAIAGRDAWLHALQCLWGRDDGQTLCLGHGDAHLGQTYVDRLGRPGLIDWQCAGLMPWSKDVAYFLGGALSIADRRAHERDLLAIYLDALGVNCGPAVDPDAAWQDYRCQMLQGICWTMVTEQMQPLEAITVMNERYLTAIKDLGTIELVLAGSRDHAVVVASGKKQGVGNA